ncbi:MAG: amidohydrolase family protein [Dehalococcoidia bacterium]
MIIDAHAHAFPPDVIARREELLATEPAFADIYADPGAKMATADDVLASMDQAGVDRTVICNFTWKSEDLIDETNEYLLNEAIRARGRLIPFVSMSFAGAGRHGGVDADEAVGGATVGESRSKIRQLAAAGARGIGELRPESTGFNLANSDEADLIAWSAAAFDLAVLVHASEPVGHLYAGKRGLSLDALCTFAAQSPGMTLIAAHWGGGLPFYTLMPELRDALQNVWFDTAAGHLLYHPQVYRRVIDLVGVERILWGSDFPLTTQAKALERTRDAGLTDDELAAVLGSNIASLLML